MKSAKIAGNTKKRYSPPDKKNEYLLKRNVKALPYPYLTILFAKGQEKMGSGLAVSREGEFELHKRKEILIWYVHLAKLDLLGFQQPVFIIRDLLRHSEQEVPQAFCYPAIFMNLWAIREECRCG